MSGRAEERVIRDAPWVAPREPRPDVCEHGRPDHFVMIGQLAAALGIELPAIAASPAQVYETLLVEVEHLRKYQGAITDAIVDGRLRGTGPDV